MNESVAYRASAWHRWFQGVIRALYYSRVTIQGREHLPSSGPLLLVMLHRNGAVDGFVYRALWPKICYTLKANLRRSLFGRIFFDGLEMVRSEDGDDAEGNRAVVDRCVDVLQQGAALGASHAYAKVLQTGAAGIPEEMRRANETWKKRLAANRMPTRFRRKSPQVRSCAARRAIRASPRVLYAWGRHRPRNAHPRCDVSACLPLATARWRDRPHRWRARHHHAHRVNEYFHCGIEILWLILASCTFSLPPWPR